MKVVQVTPRYSPQTGGVETHVQEISERLVGHGHDVTVFTADAGTRGKRREECNGVKIRRYNSFSSDEAFHFSPQLAFAVRKTNVDVVHAHNFHSLPLFFTALGITDQRFIVTPHYHGGSANTIRDHLLSLYRPFGEWALNSAEEVVAVSNWERMRLLADFGVSASLIPNGVNLDRFAKSPPENSGRPYLLCVGRLSKYKGIQKLIRALPELPDYKLVVAGTGSYEKELRAIARRTGVLDRVDFLGYVDDDRLPKLYAGAEVYVSLSSFEAFGLTVGEALAAGTPAVITRNGGLSDWASKEGVVVVDSVESQDIVRAIQRAARVARVTTDLPTWDQATEKLLAIYQGLEQ